MDLVAFIIFTPFADQRHTFLGSLENIQNILRIICFPHKMAMFGTFRDVNTENQFKKKKNEVAIFLSSLIIISQKDWRGLV